jgi:hypothetical protein
MPLAPSAARRVPTTPPAVPPAWRRGPATWLACTHTRGALPGHHVWSVTQRPRLVRGCMGPKPHHTTPAHCGGGGGVCALSPAPSRRRRRQCVTRAALNYFYWGNISGVPGSGATCKSWCAARCMEWEALASAWCGGRQTKASTKRRAPPGSSSSVRYTGRVEPRPAALAPHGARSPPQQHERESAKPLRHTLKGRERMACTGNKPCRRP